MKQATFEIDGKSHTYSYKSRSWVNPEQGISDPPKKLYKVVGKNLEPIHGGQGQWVVGQWWITSHRSQGTDAPVVIEPCHTGLHLATDGFLGRWIRTDSRLFEVEVAGLAIKEEDKYVVAAAKLVREIPVTKALIDALSNSNDPHSLDQRQYARDSYRSAALNERSGRMKNMLLASLVNDPMVLGPLTEIEREMVKELADIDFGSGRRYEIYPRIDRVVENIRHRATLYRRRIQVLDLEVQFRRMDGGTSFTEEEKALRSELLATMKSRQASARAISFSEWSEGSALFRRLNKADKAVIKEEVSEQVRDKMPPLKRKSKAGLSALLRLTVGVKPRPESSSATRKPRGK